jgi:hypothetical protein
VHDLSVAGEPESGALSLMRGMGLRAHIDPGGVVPLST